jgi:hypothetical protein
MNTLSYFPPLFFPGHRCVLLLLCLGLSFFLFLLCLGLGFFFFRLCLGLGFFFFRLCLGLGFFFFRLCLGLGFFFFRLCLCLGFCRKIKLLLFVEFLALLSAFDFKMIDEFLKTNSLGDTLRKDFSIDDVSYSGLVLWSCAAVLF